MMEVKSHKYDLSGKYLVTKKEGTFYKFTHRDTTRGSGKNSIISTYVPEEDVDDEVEGFDKKEVSNTTAGGARKTRKGRKGSRRSRAKGTRRRRHSQRRRA
jgi:hypothetical protein